jgi:hypothetical protein
MNNPRSLCWAIEMFAYAILGAVTWLVVRRFAGGALPADPAPR